jgi:hypothetical protein
MYVTRIQRSVLSAVSRNRGRSWNVLPANYWGTPVHNLKMWPWASLYNLAGHMRPPRRGLEAHGQSTTNF